MSGSSLIVALNLGERRLALKLGNSEFDLTAAAKSSLLKGELRLAPPLPAPVRSVVVCKTPLFVPLLMPIIETAPRSRGCLCCWKLIDAVPGCGGGDPEQLPLALDDATPR